MPPFSTTTTAVAAATTSPSVIAAATSVTATTSSTTRHYYFLHLQSDFLKLKRVEYPARAQQRHNPPQQQQLKKVTSQVWLRGRCHEFDLSCLHFSGVVLTCSAVLY